MKKSVLILLILITALLTGCGKDPGPAGDGNSTAPTGSEGRPDTPETDKSPVIDPDNACYTTFDGEEVWGETYALYHSNNGQLMLFDTVSGLRLPYCFDAACPHTGQGYLRPNGEQVPCISYDFSMTAFSLRDDGSYFYDRGSSTLYRADREGRNRKEVAQITDPVSLATHIFSNYYTKDELFFNYVCHYEVIPVEGSDGPVPGEWVTGERLEKNEAGIYRINLNDGTASYLYRINEYDCLVYNLHVYNGHLYFVSEWLDVPFDSLPDGFADYEAYTEALREHRHLAVCDCDLSSGELRQIAAYEKASQAVYFGDGFYVVKYNDNEKPAELFRTSGEKIRDLNFNIQLCPSAHSDRYLYYQYYVDEYYTYGIYDIVEDTVIKEITLYGSDAPGPWAAAVGDAYYFEGEHLYYINAEDLWNGNSGKRVELR